MDSRVEVSLTGTSHHDSLLGAGTSGSVSTWMTVLVGDSLAAVTALPNASAESTRTTSTPRLSAFAARSTGSFSPSSRPEPSAR